MTTPMTPRQRQLAEEHMDLVPRMVAALTKGFSLSSDQRRELCQTGYLALCRAAVSCRDGYDFPPYANAAIRNAIYDFWRRDIREKDRLCPLTEDQPDPFCKEPGRSATEEGPDAFSLSLKDTEAGAYLETQSEWSDSEQQYVSLEEAGRLLEAVQSDLEAGRIGRRFLLHSLERLETCYSTDLVFFLRTDPSEESRTVSVTLQTTARDTLAVLEELGLTSQLRLLSDPSFPASE